jgi:drug/metabolite transporter (DMT)-like permease
VALVLLPKLAAHDAAALPHAVVGATGTAQWIVVTAAIFAVLTITARTLYQKTLLVERALDSAAALQNAGAALVAAGFALVLGEHRFIAAPQLWASLAWGIVMLLGVATTLLVWMVRRGDASRATALLFLRCHRWPH